MKNGATVNIVDRKSQQWKNYEAKLRGKKLDGSEVVDIGLFGEQGSDLVAYATQNEFGDPIKNIPPRPFLRSTMFVHRKDIIRFIAKMKEDVLFGRSSIDTYLDKIGIFVQGLVQKRIKTAKTWAAPNSPKTIALKRGGDAPLVDTGRMRDSIIYRVRRQVGKMIAAIAGM